MCEAPNQLRDGSLIACRKCRQCRHNRVEEWVGRCIAESKTAVATTTLELTYGRDEEGNVSHARAAILTYSDVQKYFKQLRNRGFPARYLVTGEMGSKKGRAHWHGIVFWQKAIPTGFLDYGRNSWHWPRRAEPVWVDVEWETRFNEPCWPHGFSFWQTVKKGNEKGSVMYACKYLQKDLDDPASQTKLAMSKLPPIGADYFVKRAQKYVDERIAPQDGFYQFPGDARRKNGKPFNFMLRGKLKEIFCEAFLDKWKEQVGGHYPPSDFIEEYEDRKLRKEDGNYEYVGGDRYEYHPPREFNKTMGRRWPMHPPFGFTDADIDWDAFIDAPVIRTPTEWLWYGPNKEGVKGWRNVEPEIERYVSKYLSAIQSRQRKDPPPCEWLSGSRLLGEWRLMKVPQNGKLQWGISLMPSRRQNGPRGTV